MITSLAYISSSMYSPFDLRTRWRTGCCGCGAAKGSYTPIAISNSIQVQQTSLLNPFRMVILNASVNLSPPSELFPLFSFSLSYSTKYEMCEGFWRARRWPYAYFEPALSAREKEKGVGCHVGGCVSMDVARGGTPSSLTVLKRPVRWLERLVRECQNAASGCWDSEEGGVSECFLSM